MLEKDYHLFFTCEFARAIWFSAAPALRTDVLSEGQNGIQAAILATFETATHSPSAQDFFYHPMVYMEGLE